MAPGVESVYAKAGKLIPRARRGGGPGILYVTCHRPGGHFEGDPLVTLMRDPKAKIANLAPGIRAGATNATGGTRRERTEGVAILGKRVGRVVRDWTLGGLDPLPRGRKLLDDSTATRIERTQRAALRPAIDTAREAVAGVRSSVQHREVSDDHHVS
jgi:acetoin:2,6-dichlorophenolindophenol oxidoreductase subunit alpha